MTHLLATRTHVVDEVGNLVTDEAVVIVCVRCDTRWTAAHHVAGNCSRAPRGEAALAAINAQHGTLEDLTGGAA